MGRFRARARARASGPPRPAVQGWRVVGGQRCYFRSKAEANYARYLELLRASGKIESWEYEPHTFWFLDEPRGVRSYLPDFRVMRTDGTILWVEIKGYMDARSKTKLRRMAKYYPAVSVKLVLSSQVEKLTRSIGSLIPGWE